MGLVIHDLGPEEWAKISGACCRSGNDSGGFRELLFLLNFVEITICDIILVSQFGSTNRQFDEVKCYGIQGFI